MRRSVTIFVVTVLLGGCVIAAGCEALDPTSTTAGGGGGAAGGTTIASGSTPTSVPASTSDTGGGTWVTGESGNSVLGKWHNAITGETLEFLPNGMVLGNAYAEAHGLTSTYAISGNQITFDVGGLVTVVDTFSIEGNTLTLVDTASGVAGTLQRVE